MTEIASLMEQYNNLPPSDKAEIDKLLVEDAEEVPWRPLINAKEPEQLTPQKMAYDSPADILLFGGAAGGGKSSLMIGLALTAHTKSVIYRREVKQLGPIEEEIIRIRKTRTGFNGQLHRFDLGKGRAIRLGGMQYAGDEVAYQGDPRDLICVARGTGVLRPDGSYTPIEQIRGGDEVATLEGPKRVLRTFPAQYKKAVRVDAFSPDGGFIGSQVQGEKHELLTTSGWVCHGKLLSTPHASSVVPTLLNSLHRFASPLAKRLWLTWQAVDIRFQDIAQRIAPSLSHEGLLNLMGLHVSYAQSILGNDFGSFDDSLRSELRFLESSGFSKPLRPSQRSRAFDCGQSALWHEETYAQSSSSLLDFLGSYLDGSHHNDEPLRSDEVDAQLYLHRQVGVDAPIHGSSDLGGKGGIRKCNHSPLSYAHPYTRGIRQILPSVGLVQSSYDVAPVRGLTELYDIHVEDVNSYITEHGFISSNCFDELTQFLESQFRYVTTWNRSADANQRCRIVCATNPPTSAEGQWVVDYWAPWLDREHPNPAKPGELRWFISDPDGKDIEVANGDPVWQGDDWVQPRSRTFIPSSVDDNPFLINSGYKAALQALPEPLRSQMLMGDFTAGVQDDPWQVIPTAWIELAQARWTEEKPSGVKMDALGVDPARGGKDRFILTPRYGNWFGEQICLDGASTPDGPTGAAICTTYVRDGAQIMLDVIGGAGASILDHLRSNGANVYKVDGRKESGERDASGTLGFYNTRSMLWWRMREALNPNNSEPIALPPDRELKVDLTAPKWQLTSRGIQVEGKSTECRDGFGDLKKRIGRSPDKGDSCVYALVPAQVKAGKYNSAPKRTQSRYNPHRNWRR